MDLLSLTDRGIVKFSILFLGHNLLGCVLQIIFFNSFKFSPLLAESLLKYPLVIFLSYCYIACFLSHQLMYFFLFLFLTFGLICHFFKNFSGN